jgi:phosphoglycerate dehydrogenase-like enzyme
MKPTAFLINTSRGPIINEADLVRALKEHKIQGAGLDVFNVEPLPLDHPLRTLDNVTLTPHVGYVDDDMYKVTDRTHPCLAVDISLMEFSLAPWNF